MIRRPRCPSGAELLAFQDGALSNARQTEIAEHLKDCQPCRQYLRESEEIGRLLRAHIPLVDDPIGRARLKERLRDLPQPAPPDTTSRSTTPYRLLAVGLAVVIVLAAGLAWTGEIEGGSSFTRFWREAESPNRVVPADRVRQTPVTAPETVIAPPSLPFGLALTEGSSPEADRFGEWFYRNDSGLTIRLAADPPGQGWLPVAGVDDHQEITGHNGRDIVVMYGIDHTTVDALFWVDAGSLHSLSILTSPPDGFVRDDALEIVAALMGDE